MRAFLLFILTSILVLLGNITYSQRDVFSVTSQSGKYVINGEGGSPDITLNRGESYTFNISAPEHPFRISSLVPGYGYTEYTLGVDASNYNSSTGTGTIVFDVPIDAPDNMYYECEIHDSMIGTIYVSSSIECGIEQSDFFNDREIGDIMNINLEVNRILKSKKKNSSARQSQEGEEYYIPVVINLLLPPNPHDNSISSASGLNVYSEEHALWIIDKLNETYNSSYGYTLNGQTPISGFQQNTAKINFIPAIRDINNVPGFQFFRVFNLENYADQIADFTNSCTPNDPDPYYSFENDYAGQTTEIWFPYIGSSPTYLGHNVVVWSSKSCMSTVSYGQSLLNLFGYEPDEYLNINVMFGCIGSIQGFASLPNTGFRCFIKSSTYSSYSATVPHEAGHFFGLQHTWNSTSDCDVALSRFQSEETCQITGDFVCDTYPTKKDGDNCYSGETDSHCNIHSELIPTEHFNIMDYTNGCTHENFTPGQIERMRAFLEISDRNPHTLRGIENLAPELLCGDPSACNYNEAALSDYDPTNCKYFDVVGVCGGSCLQDVDSDGVCDDIDGCIAINGNVDTNGNGICDNEDPCGTLSEIDGIINDTYSTAKAPVIAIGNRCWAGANSRVDKFADGSSIPFTSTRSTFVSKTEDGEPIRTRPTNMGNNAEEPFPSFVWQNIDFIRSNVYNWYAVTDDRGICPSGWHVSTDEDWIDLEIAIGYQENEIIRPLRKNNVTPAFTLINELGFFNTAVDYYTGEIETLPYPLPSGYVDQYGYPRKHAQQEFIWTTDEYVTKLDGYKTNNVYFRRIETPYRWYPVESSSENPTTSTRVEWLDLAVNREYMLNSTSGSKNVAMSVRCVKDID